MLSTVSTKAQAQCFDQGCCPINNCGTVADQGFGATVWADFLWWKADVENTLIGTKALVSNNTQLYQGSTLLPDGQWRPGVRVGLGYTPRGCNSLGLSASWTYFETQSNRICATAPAEPSFSAPFTTIAPAGTSLLGPRASKASGQWHLKTNLLDIEVGKELPVSCGFSFTPHGGIRVGWFNFRNCQKFKGIWTSFTDLANPLTVRYFTDDTSLLSKFIYNAAGLKIGSDANWHVTEQFSILAKLSGSLLYGRYKTDIVINGFQPDPLRDTLPANIPVKAIIEDKLFRGRTNLEDFLELSGIRSFAMIAIKRPSAWVTILPSGINFTRSLQSTIKRLSLNNTMVSLQRLL